MLFHFGIQKTIQAAAVLLRFERTRRMSYFRLLKLLYLADRDSIQETARPIIGGLTVTLPHGPLHSEVLDLVNGQHRDEPEWSKFIRKDGYNIELLEAPGVLDLSRYEIGKLKDISEQFALWSDWEIADYTHKLPEVNSRRKEDTSVTIPFEAIIDAVDRSKDKEAILQDARDHAGFDRVFGGLSE